MFVRTVSLRMSAGLLASLLAPTGAATAAESVNVYTYREPALIEPILKAFTEKTGIAVNMVFSKDGLVERLAAEGKNSPADVLITAESGLLVQAKAAGVTQSLEVRRGRQARSPRRCVIRKATGLASRAALASSTPRKIV